MRGIRNMRKIVLTVVILFAVFTFIKAYASAKQTGRQSLEAKSSIEQVK